MPLSKLKRMLIHSNLLKNFFVFCIILYSGIILRSYIFSSIYFFNIKYEPIFFSEYIFTHIYLNLWISIGIGLINIYLLTWLGLKVYNLKFGFFLSLLYAISPWSAYVDIFGGNSNYFLFWILIFAISIVFLKQHKRWSLILLFFSLIGVLTASIFSIPVLITLLGGIYMIKYLNKEQTIKLFSACFVTFLLVLFMMLTNIDATKNIIRQNIKIFQDPGTTNFVNVLRGEMLKSGFGSIGKLGENKYLFLGEKILLNFSMNFSPAMFFTPQFKLFDFSFSPPVFLGFLIPFILGVITLSKERRHILAVVILIFGLSLPSVLNKDLPDLTKLVLVSPIIYTFTALGLVKISQNLKKPGYKKLALIIFLLVSFQVLIVISDINLRERIRYELFFNQFS